MPGITAEEAKKEMEELVNKRKAELNIVPPKPQAEKTPDPNPDAADAAKQAEEQAKKDEALLVRPDAEITDDAEKARKQELLDKQKHKETPDPAIKEDKVEKRKQEIQSDIDKLTAQKKELENAVNKTAQMKKEVDALRQDIDALKKEREAIEAEKRIPEEHRALKKQEDERLVKYLNEDTELPREQRREMSRDELEAWFDEDRIAAQEWISERTLRRARERSADIKQHKQNAFVKDFTTKQEDSNKRVLSRYPELDTSSREDELKRQGKSQEEIQKTLFNENEKFRICAEIVGENPEKYLTKENGPELVMAEMEKRISVKTSKTSDNDENAKRIEKLEKQLEELSAENERLRNSDEGIPSGGTRSKGKSETLTDDEKRFMDTLNDTGVPQDRRDAMLKRYRENKGKSSHA
jgi:hypothetical protein